MSNKHLSLKPHQIKGSNGSAWWYEESSGIYLYRKHFNDDGKSSITYKCKILWRSIRAALKREDKRQ